MALNLEAYFKGKGVNLSIDSNLPGKKINLPVNNLYFLKDYLNPESQDFFYIKNISETKFHRVLLKEMLIYSKVNGYLIIKYGNKEILSFKKLIKEVSICSNAISKIIVDSNNKVIIIQKIKKFLHPSDRITKWSFGIITNGKKNDWVEMQIQSIKDQKIPFYEIIVCGTYFDKKEPNFKYISFNEKDELGWITKKKNIICENAKYENLCILHDRIILGKNWFRGMKKYGNYFEILSCVIKNKEGNRSGDWITYGNKFGRYSKIGFLDYKDSDRFGYLDGAMYLLKKSIWLKQKWDEHLFWNDGEDIKLSQDWYNLGVLLRFNPYSKCETLNWRHGALPIYFFNPYKLGKYPISVYKKIIPLIKFYIKKIIKVLKNKSLTQQQR